MKQTLYALVYSPENNQDNSMHIEFIDSTLLGNSAEYMRRANNFFQGQNTNYMLFEGEYEGIRDNIVKNYYIDVLEAYISRENLQGLFNDVNGVACYFVQAYHRRYSDQEFVSKEGRGNIVPIERCFDINYIKNNLQINGTNDDEADYLELSILKRDDTYFEIIKQKMKLDLPSVETIDFPDNIRGENSVIKHEKYKFRVHNVGQALATSLSLDGELPFLYIDYGMPHGQNNKTRPSEINMPIEPGETIILTHLDKDHWFRVEDDSVAYKCNWLIPNQPRKVQVGRIISEILSCGGTVKFIERVLNLIGVDLPVVEYLV